MDIPRKMYAILLVSLLIGCSDTHKLVRSEDVKLPASQEVSAYIALPEDGRYGDIYYRGSGEMVAKAVRVAFSPYLKKSEIASRRESRQKALKTAQERGLDYLIYAEILHWEDRNTGWSGRPDVVNVRITIYDVSSGDVVDSAEVGGTSKVMSWSLEHPQDLLPKPLSDYARSLFAA